MNTNLQGNIGESVALKYFIREGYEVYLPFGTATSCDMIVLKDNLPERVSVKTATRRSKNGKGWMVKISQGKMKKTEAFNPDSSDLLFVYILPEDTYHIFKSKAVDKKYELTIQSIII